MFQKLAIALSLLVAPATHAQWTAEQRLLSLFQMIPEDLESLDPEDANYQNPIQILSWVGREDIAEAMLENAPELIRTVDCPEIGSLNALFDEIAEDPSGPQIVMLNETHFDPRHRMVAQRLAEILAEQGFAYFAAETFNIRVAEGRVPGSVPFNIGAYSYEPIYARMLRGIDDLGLSPLAYEQRPEQQPENPETWEARINAREIAQTENLMAALFEHTPDARVFIYVGGGHLQEQPVYREGREEVRWFGNRLAEATGVNPVTIVQYPCVSESGAVWADGSETSSAGRVDYFIGHPPLEFERNRPTWRREIGDIDIEIPAELLSDNDRIVVEAHPVGGTTDDVAIERLMLWPGEDIPLLLPPGRYDLRSYTSEGLLAGPVEITVGE